MYVYIYVCVRDKINNSAGRIAFHSILQSSYLMYVCMLCEYGGILIILSMYV